MVSPTRDDIDINGLRLRLFRQKPTGPRGIQGSDQPQLATDQFVDNDLPLRQDTWHLGAGYSMRLIPGTYAYAVNGDGRFPRMFMPGPQMNPVTLTSATDKARWAFDLGSDTYFGGGRYAYRAVGGSASSPLTNVQDFGSGVIGYSGIRFGNNGADFGWVGTDDGTGKAGALWRVFTDNTWAGNLASLNRKHLTAAYYNSTNGYRMFGLTDTTGNNEIKTVAPGSDATTNGNWGTAFTVGDASSITINKLVALQDHVYVLTDQGVYDFDGGTGNTFNVTPAQAQRRNSENGIGGCTWNQWVMYGHKHGTLRYQAQGFNAGIVEDVSFGYRLPNETPIRGQVTAMCADRGWVVEAIWNGTDTYICWGRDVGAGDTVPNQQLGLGYGPSPLALTPSPMIWHGGVIKLTGQKCYLLFISGQTDPPKLWVGNGANVQWCYLPRTENPIQDSDYRFATSYSVYMPWEDWGRPATAKNLIQLDVEGDNLGVGASIQFQYSVDNGPYAVLGSANGSPFDSILPGTEIIGRRISVAANGTNTNTAGANMRAYILRAAERVTVRQLRTYTVDLEYDAGDRFGGHRASLPLKVLESLRGLSQSGQVIMRDEYGENLTVLIEPPVSFQEVRSDGVSDKEQPQSHLVATVRVSVLKRLGSTFKWNDGTTFNSGKVWM